MGLSILSFVLLLILVLIYLELLPKHLWPWSLVHRRYNHAQAIWLWSVLSRKDVRERGFCKARSRPSLPCMRRAASLAVQSIDQGLPLDQTLRCTGWGIREALAEVGENPSPSIAVEHAFDWARRGGSGSRRLGLGRAWSGSLSHVIDRTLAGLSVILFFSSLHSILVVPY